MVLPASPARADDDPELVGQWSTPFDLQVIGIHSTLLPGGKVLIFHRPQLSVGSDARVWDPVTGSLTDVSFTSERDIFCAGQTVLSDGRVWVTGGHLHNGQAGAGVKDTNLFDPVTDTWTAGPSLSYARWYPTDIELSDGTALVFGGTASKTNYVAQVERFDPVAGTLIKLPSTATKKVSIYPRMHLLPSGQIAMVGQGRATWLFNPTTSTWTKLANMSFGARNYGTSVLLPGLQKILTFGGSGPTGTTNSAEILDFSQASPGWRSTVSMTYPRRHTNGVLLADGTVLAVGGGASQLYSGPVLQPELFDPVSESWSLMAAQEAPRMYHSTALLLPDGTVFSAGQDKDSAYSYTGEIYSPPYLFKGDRPTISSVDASVVYGQQFGIATPNAGDITRVALVKPGAVTHSVNFDQRYVDLSWAQDGDGNLVATAPLDGNQAPPGWYMLFVMNSDGVPSVASWVHVGTELTGPLSQDERAGSRRTSTSSESLSGFPVGRPSGSAGRPGFAVVVVANEDDTAATNPGFSYVCNRRWVARHQPKTHT